MPGPLMDTLDEIDRKSGMSLHVLKIRAINLNCSKKNS